MSKIISKYYFYKGIAAFRKKNYKLASQYFKNSINHYSKNIRAILAYSVSSLYSNEFLDSKIALENIDLSLASKEQKKTYIINYAISLYMIGEREKAINLLENEHNKNTFGLLQQTLGYMYVDNKNFDKAYEFISDSLNYDPQDSIFLDNMAQYYYRSENRDLIQAKKYFDEAIKINPNQIDTLYFLAMYDIEAGDIDKAKIKLNRALLGNFSPLNYATPEKINSLMNTLK